MDVRASGLTRIVTSTSGNGLPGLPTVSLRLNGRADNFVLQGKDTTLTHGLVRVQRQSDVALVIGQGLHRPKGGLATLFFAYPS